MLIKKYWVFIFFLLFITGCEKSYTLFISDKEIKEQVDIVVDNTDENRKQFESNIYPRHSKEAGIYEKKIIEDNKKLKIRLNYTYPEPELIVDSNTISNCFKNKKIVTNNEKYYYINISKILYCKNIINSTVNIKTNNKVEKHNAEKVRGNTYTWYITDDNKDDFKLEIKILKGVKKNAWIYRIVLFASGIVVVVFIVSFIYTLIKKIKRNNSI